MPRPAPLSGPEAAKNTLAHRFTPLADRLRQLNTSFGLRPYRVFLVWTQWSGEERGEGTETTLVEVELLPTPKVSDLTALARRPYSAGVFSEGTLRITQISAGAYTSDHLTGLKIPMPSTSAPRADRGADVNPMSAEPTSNPRVDFFWEIRDDGRGDDPSARTRYRMYGKPNRAAGRLQWEVSIQEASEPRDRSGRTQIGVDTSQFPSSGLPQRLP